MKYILRSQKTSASILVQFENRLIKMIEFTEASAKQVDWFFKNAPVDESRLIAFCKANQLKVNSAYDDLSFMAFWNAFDHKVDKKERVRKLWSALTDAEKQAAFAAIPSYHRFIKIMNQNSAYPGTWLNNRMWENEYIVK